MPKKSKELSKEELEKAEMESDIQAYERAKKDGAPFIPWEEAKKRLDKFEKSKKSVFQKYDKLFKRLLDR